ncbi:hypothetical protein KKF84_08435, partial [Myxococcota bacterium]|nr:hypothetical protein [Myxococcota bacterium]
DTQYISAGVEDRDSKLIKYAGPARIEDEEDGYALRWFHKDHLGTSTLTTNDDGSVANATLYLPYGGTEREYQEAGFFFRRESSS